MDLTPEELLCRRDTLKQFENYIADATNTLNNFVEKLGWTLDKTPTEDALVKCPINDEHRMLPSKLDVHCQTCILKQNGYDSTHSLYPSYNNPTSSAQTIKIDKITQMNILKTAYEESNFTLNMIKESLVQNILQYFHYVPKSKKINTCIKPELREVSQSIERYVCDFTPDERRVLYDSAVKNTKLPHYDIGNDLTGVDFFTKNDEKPKTELEVLEELRDLKRRRAAYRGKKVHTDKKSYVEVLREVVEGLTSTLSPQEDKSVGTENTETLSNNRIIYKYEGNRNYSGNPYTRWLDIETEESKIIKYRENKSYKSYQESNSSGIQHSRDKNDKKKSRKSLSKSRKRSSSSESKIIKSRRSNSRSFQEIKSIRPKARSKLKETTYYKKSISRSISTEYKHKRFKVSKNQLKSNEKNSSKSRSRSISTEYKHKRFKVSKTQLKSNEKNSSKSRSRSMSIESEHKRSKRHRTQFRSKELSSSKKVKRSRSPNEKYTSVKLKLNNSHKKEKKHKKKKKHHKSSKRSHKSKNNSDIEVGERVEDKMSIDDDDVN